MRRHLSWIFASTLLLGGLAACGDDDDNSDDTETTTTEDGGSDSTETTEGGGDEESSGGNAEVQAYCDEVESFAEAVADAGTDPSALAGLTEDSTALAEASADLQNADLDEDDAQALADCSERAAEALQELVPG